MNRVSPLPERSSVRGYPKGDVSRLSKDLDAAYERINQLIEAHEDLATRFANALLIMEKMTEVARVNLGDVDVLRAAILELVDISEKHDRRLAGIEARRSNADPWFPRVRS